MVFLLVTGNPEKLDQYGEKLLQIETTRNILWLTKTFSPLPKGGEGWGEGGL
jgi:hypothetical protein